MTCSGADWAQAIANDKSQTRSREQHLGKPSVTGGARADVRSETNPSLFENRSSYTGAEYLNDVVYAIPIGSAIWTV